MIQEEKSFEPSHYQAGPVHGLMNEFEPGTRTLPAGSRIDPRFRTLPTDIVLDKDVAVTLRDGVTIRVDVFRPAGTEKVPVIVAWSPYGKNHGTAPSVLGLFTMLGIDNGTLSGLQKFEGPDPAYWCAQGYAVCNPDPRGIANSEGDSVMFGRQEGQDCHDLIEWLAVQDWCTGKVAMSGTSYLAIAQWFTAAEQPPHLAAINPWEGLSDVYRDLVLRGGMPDIGFAERLQKQSYEGNNLREDILTEAERHPLVDELWEDKVPRFERVTVPAYVVASYSNTLHTAGTFRGWRRIASEDKWLRIHNTQEWPDYYDEEHVEDLRRFFDHYLKGEDNGWEQTPRVRYSLLDLEGGDRVDLAADSFPPADVTRTKYYLDARSRTLTTAQPAEGAQAAYRAESKSALASFVVGFAEETTMVGYPMARLWVEADGADDMDLFVLVQKLDRHGTPLQQFTVPGRSAMLHDLTEHGASVLRYKGSNGRLRVSARHLDKALATEDVPAHSFDRIEKLSPGEVVDVEIDLLPIGLVFHPGEQLRLVVSAQNALGGLMPMTRDYIPRNSGQHIIHTGGDRASYLQLPVKNA
ncbi:CocE/NonD family hydrolase [Kitasatospora sp. NBC_00240]|uniref:CocE/NonD family hydrolase n=1 Tax=Kitasatospora sp. NBC_00240 TaxID=2903567 RepID=UPI0022520E4B|nr:CocE/NonD family hydrolase [Kitasatospora sp. NBC_00240]MCX5214760.1 CocE/NonD family hydrolase [Kitasatospora sp. NBC_00240]